MLLPSWGLSRLLSLAAIAGESVQLLPVKLPEPWTEITWEVTLDSALTYRIVTFNKGEPPDFGPSPYFINRVTFHPENLSLQIDPVKKSDSGLYTLIIDTGGGRENQSLLSDRVRHPNLTVLSAHAELGQCNVTLSCSVPGADRATYDWYQGTSRIPSDRDHQLPGHQSLLHVVINADSSDVFYRCNASNRASWDADTVDVKSLCDTGRERDGVGVGIMKGEAQNDAGLWGRETGGLGGGKRRGQGNSVAGRTEEDPCEVAALQQGMH
uniref:Ig-like domain-containing protein n=1 Tax=Chrysemys picta bellii TaxID=8478 RepID=A0A8C3ISJ3_CHRPI